MIKFFQEGGAFMYIILLVGFVGLLQFIITYLKLLIYDLRAVPFLNKIQSLILKNDIVGAIKYCSNHKALLPRVYKNGLKRASEGEQGIEKAIEATALEVIPKIDKNAHYLGLFANVSTLLGLLGTIFGLMDSFSAVAMADPLKKSVVLSLGISKAMNTTALGLIVAISLMFLNSLLTSKRSKIMSDIDEYSAKLMDMLFERNKN